MSNYVCTVVRIFPNCLKSRIKIFKNTNAAKIKVTIKISTSEARSYRNTDISSSDIQFISTVSSLITTGCNTYEISNSVVKNTRTQHSVGLESYK